MRSLAFRGLLAVLAAGWSTGGLAAEPQAAPADVGAQVAAYRPAAEDEGQFRKYFFFRKTGVSPQDARADLAECRGYTRGLVYAPLLPKHVPPARWAVQGADSHMYGLGGEVALALVSPALVRAVAAANLRKCMGFKGYERYGLSKDLWEALNPKDADQALALQAQIAAGPAPAQAALFP